MPWTVKDVPRFTKKAKTAAQKKKWVSIANRVLTDCQKSGGENCDAKAIRVANSKFSEEAVVSNDLDCNRADTHRHNFKGGKKMKLPKGALRLVDKGRDCHAFAVMDEEGKKKKLSIKAYSGKTIEGHWYWGKLAIDLTGMRFEEARYPVLEDHRTDRKIGHIGKPVITDKFELMSPEDDAVFVDTEASEEFQKLSQQKFPYQASIYAKPTRVERVEEGATAEVNGFTLKGPASIWRECMFKEMSVCVFGWDSKTQSSAFSRDVEEEIDEYEETVTKFSQGGTDGDSVATNDAVNHYTREEVSKKMNLDELKKEHPDLFAQVVEIGRSDAEKAADEKIDALSAKFDTLTSTLSELQAENAELSKEVTLSKEQKLKAEADKIWAAQLAESDLPGYMHKKIVKHVAHTQFVDDDGKFDVEAFTESVKEEIAEWADHLSQSDNDPDGQSFTSKETDGEESQLFEENKKLSDGLMKHIDPSFKKED